MNNVRYAKVMLNFVSPKGVLQTAPTGSQIPKQVPLDYNFKKYFLRKVAERKNKRLVLNNIENKLLKIVFAVVNSGVAYTNNYKAINPALLKTA